jgi:hypothetical protein
MKICSQCQKENSEDLNFCGGCGNRLQESTPSFEGFLKGAGLDFTIPILLQNDIHSVADLKTLNENDVEELGIAYGDKLRLKSLLGLAQGAITSAKSSSGDPSPDLAKLSLREIEQLAYDGNGHAMVFMGKAYWNGSSGVNADKVESKTWFKRAAKVEHPEGIFLYAEYFLRDDESLEGMIEHAGLVRRAGEIGWNKARILYEERLEENKEAYLIDGLITGNEKAVKSVKNYIKNEFDPFDGDDTYINLCNFCLYGDGDARMDEKLRIFIGAWADIKEFMGRGNAIKIKLGGFDRAIEAGKLGCPDAQEFLAGCGIYKDGEYFHPRAIKALKDGKPYDHSINHGPRLKPEDFDF